MESISTENEQTAEECEQATCEKKHESVEQPVTDKEDSTLNEIEKNIVSSVALTKDESDKTNHEKLTTNEAVSTDAEKILDISSQAENIEAVQEEQSNDKQLEMEIVENATDKNTTNATNDSPLILSNILLAKGQTVPELTADVEVETSQKSEGLSLLAQYDSDEDNSKVQVMSDTDSVVEVPVTGSKNYRGNVVEIDSDDDSAHKLASSTSSDSDSEGEYLTQIRKDINKRIQTVDDEDDEDEDNDAEGQPRRRRQPPKVKGELTLDELPPIQDLQITVPEEECVELGRVHSIVDQLVLVNALPNSVLLDLDSILFLDKGRKVLGEVFDVLGQVSDPLYCVRFNSNQQIKDRGINIGDAVYCAPKTEYTQFVILSKLVQIRGSDASWEHDVEPPPRYLDYSDDEEEREARARLRNKDRPYENNEETKRSRADSNVSSGNSSVHNVDAPSPSQPRQRGRRYARERERGNTNGNYQRGENVHSNADGSYRSRSRDQQYNYHPSYNSGSWHSNYYHNYHPQAANFNMHAPPPMGYPVSPSPYGYYGPMPGYGMPPYAMRPPMNQLSQTQQSMPPPYMYPVNYPPQSTEQRPPSPSNK